jgi:hypothetical protein
VSQEAISETAGIVNSINGGLRVVCSGYSAGQVVHHSEATRFTIMVSGSTYPHKDVLKGFGLRWDPAEKVWRGTIDRSQLQQVESLEDVRLCVVPSKETETSDE